MPHHPIIALESLSQICVLCIHTLGSRPHMRVWLSTHKLYYCQSKYPKRQLSIGQRVPSPLTSIQLPMHNANSRIIPFRCQLCGWPPLSLIVLLCLVTLYVFCCMTHKVPHSPKSAQYAPNVCKRAYFVSARYHPRMHSRKPEFPLVNTGIWLQAARHRYRQWHEEHSSL